MAETKYSAPGCKWNNCWYHLILCVCLKGLDLNKSVCLMFTLLYFSVLDLNTLALADPGGLWLRLNYVTHLCTLIAFFLSHHCVLRSWATLFRASEAKLRTGSWYPTLAAGVSPLFVYKHYRVLPGPGNSCQIPVSLTLV